MHFVEFVACFVAIEEETQSLVYISYKMNGERYPKNEASDIRSMCNLLNSHMDPSYRYVDMFAVIVNGESLWEEKEEDTITIAPVIDVSSSGPVRHSLKSPV
jgi:hypothetical protein